MFTSCSIVSTNNINTIEDVDSNLVPKEIEVEEIQNTPMINFNTVDTTDFELISNNEYSFKYNSNLWSEIDPHEYDPYSVDVNSMLVNDVAKILASNITYLSNTSALDYIELLIASIPSMPLTGVTILDYDIQKVDGFQIAIIETKAGFTKADINSLIYNQIITHENVLAIGGINNLDYKPMLSQYMLIICDDTKAYTFVSDFENSASENYNKYYKGVILEAFDSIAQTLTTSIRKADY